MRQFRQGSVKLLYLAPEALLKTNMLELLSSVPVACLTVDEAHCISEWGQDLRPEYRQLIAALKDGGFSVRPYHPGLSDEIRSENQELFICDNVQIMVATIAFGMGIDKPDVRFLVHFDLPRNIEGYCQEIGRAGRHGLRSHCLLLDSYADVQKLKYFIDQKGPREKPVANLHLSASLRFAEAEGCRCRRAIMLRREEASYANRSSARPIRASAPGTVSPARSR